ncbi:MAG: hypothetical protein A3E82_03925 [Gammaproteobacteria bacterium RIFCSPHIGHO2_12_FULL_38_11]|nr:MAG: hypothetical protein A3E82_03925 [Gammaproteobacteria bacterium RIFCSPHIGHO2_12_FULL_38_11]
MKKTEIYCALLVLMFLFFSALSIAETKDIIFPSKAFYLGVNVGGGSTEWKYLVDTTDPSDTSYTTPESVTEGGPSWGLVLGYDLSKNFAIEMQYMQFANANIQLSQYSPYPLSSMISKTDAYSLSGKFLVPMGHTHLRAFAAVGAGFVQRQDPLVNFDPDITFTNNVKRTSCVTPYMSTGLVYSFTQHWMLESGFQYYTGFGASEVDPVADFIPFAWDAYARLAYQL